MTREVFWHALYATGLFLLALIALLYTVCHKPDWTNLVALVLYVYLVVRETPRAVAKTVVLWLQKKVKDRTSC